MSHSPINRRDALLAGAGLAITATASTSASAQMPPQSTTASAILNSQSLAPAIIYLANSHTWFARYIIHLLPLPPAAESQIKQHLRGHRSLHSIFIFFSESRN